MELLDLMLIIMIVSLYMLISSMIEMWKLKKKRDNELIVGKDSRRWSRNKNK